ncbi:hypothetical protein DF3PB_5270006 [uncultured Defluviicoccus sp.]|uniref:Uncharacterized protein n=1 Tax=metagenome TaxID=256318 RepID=A0A380TJS2_9ZZZZ|nr:hypothetical protein DF3PB_5270006 [uncultured Defluviicoccus sp.]
MPGGRPCPLGTGPDREARCPAGCGQRRRRNRAFRQPLALSPGLQTAGGGCRQTGVGLGRELLQLYFTTFAQVGWSARMASPSAGNCTAKPRLPAQASINHV